jgi:hypothetical protein
MYSLQITPLVYVLLIGKETKDYNNFFEQLLLQYEYEAESILIDFESATLKSTKMNFPDAIQIGKILYEFFVRQKLFCYENRMPISFWAMPVERITVVRPPKQLYQ